MHNTEAIQERVILVAVDRDSMFAAEQSLDELEALAHTGGAITVDRFTQRREAPHPTHYLGKGKLDELKCLVSLRDATGIICDDELTNSQYKNLESALDTKIMDRTMLILDIFAARAMTAEGKLQVELAQLKYSLGHLTGIGRAMSRLGGGIGTRGPGETKLETDRRHIRNRIAELTAGLEELRTHRGVLRESRKLPVVACVGYTNAGKSTLMNALTGAGVLAEDKLFATLDVTTRKIGLPGGSEALLADTVGFIQKLPHHLIQAFRATLEELRYADILLHVVDASSEMRDEQMSVVYKTIDDLGYSDKPVITVLNKADKDGVIKYPSDPKALATVSTSALNREGLELLTLAIERVLKSFRKKMSVLIPYNEGRLISMIHGACEIISEEHGETGTFIELYADEEMQGRLGAFISP